MSSAVVTGVKELDRALSDLANRGAIKAAKAAITASLIVLEKAARAAAPAGKRGSMKRTIRRKWVKDGKYVVGGKVTLAAKHGHLVTLGTRERTRKRIGGLFMGRGNPRTGKVVGSHFFKRSTEGAMSQAISVLHDRLALQIEKEAFKAGN